MKWNEVGERWSEIRGELEGEITQMKKKTQMRELGDGSETRRVVRIISVVEVVSLTFYNDG